ncbi:TPA: primase-like DNA-binding domain-containing protein [Streptococcus pyogenes]
MYDILKDYEDLPIPSESIYYHDWCKDNGHTPLKQSTFENELSTNIPDDWVKKKSRVAGKFFPSDEIPTEYGHFPWNNEKDANGSMQSYVKII